MPCGKPDHAYKGQETAPVRGRNIPVRRWRVRGTSRARSQASSIARAWLRYSRASSFPDAHSFPWLDRKSTRLTQSLMRISYAVFCLKKKTIIQTHITTRYHNIHHAYN